MFLDTHFVIFCAEALGVDCAQLLLTLGLGRGRGAGTRLLLPRASEGRDRSLGTGPSCWFWGGKEKISHGDLVLKYLLLLASSRFCVWSRGEWLLGGEKRPRSPLLLQPCHAGSDRTKAARGRAGKDPAAKPE